MFVLLWSVIMLFATWQHVRYEYYLAVNISHPVGGMSWKRTEPWWIPTLQKFRHWSNHSDSGKKEEKPVKAKENGENLGNTKASRKKKQMYKRRILVTRSQLLFIVVVILFSSLFMLLL
jgi:dolichyl-diphosphooligosaccharide--protein glycosyltransferase